MKLADFRFVDSLRVRWAEVDMQKIVFNSHYLMYIDTALASYWRAMAVPYEDTMQAMDGDLFVRKVTLQYDAPARYDDLLQIGIRCARVGTSSLAFEVAVCRAEQALVHGELIYVFADALAQAAKPVSSALRDALRAFEAGEGMVKVRVGDWAALSAPAQAIRTTVFVEEQRIPAEMEWDSADDTAVHAVAINRFGDAVATGRLLEHVPGVAKIGRMAVLSGVRGSGIGRDVLEALISAARERGDREVLLHAQMSAAAFYRRAGFVARGPEFEEAGIAHVEMTRAL